MRGCSVGCNCVDRVTRCGPVIFFGVIRERVWERRSHHGRLIELPNLRALITLSPIQGWGQDPRKIEAVIKDDAEALAMYREAMKGQEGGDKRSKTTGDNVTSGKRVTGNSRAYSLDRVQRECTPETVAKVMAGKMKPHAALVAAGIRFIFIMFIVMVKYARRWGK